MKKDNENLQKSLEGSSNQAKLSLAEVENLKSLLEAKNSQLEDTKAQLAEFSNENSKAVLPIHISPITNGLRDSHYSNREV